MPTREAEAADGERIREVASSAMSSAYAISPGQIEAIVGEQFGDDAIEQKIESDRSVLLVATAPEDEADEDADVSADGIVGVAEASVDGSRGELRWLFVDPQHWGLGHGTELFEVATEATAQRGASEIRGATIGRNEQGQEFCEQFGFEQVDERETEIGGETFVAHVYAEADAGATDSDAEAAATEESTETDADDGTSEESKAAAGEDEGGTEPSVEIPETIEADDGTRLYVGRDDPLSGIEGPFYQTFEDEDREEAYSYLCGNCGSTDVAMGDMGRIECEECGNQHRTKDNYDASYL